MPCNTFQEARHTIFKMLEAGLPAGHYIRYQGLEDPASIDINSAWSAAFIHFGDSWQATLAGDAGIRLYNRIGSLIVQSFGPLSQSGSNIAENLAQATELCFKGKSGAGGICFHKFRSVSVGPTNAWWQYNTVVGFEYSENI